LLGFVICGWLIGWSIRDWHGNVNHMLFLKLLDATQKGIPSDEEKG
jgi:hypothetical protein